MCRNRGSSGLKLVNSLDRPVAIAPARSETFLQPSRDHTGTYTHSNLQQRPERQEEGARALQDASSGVARAQQISSAFVFFAMLQRR